MRKFSLTTFTFKIDNFSLLRSVVSKLVLPAFGQGKFVRLYGCQRKVDKCQEILLWFWQTKGSLSWREMLNNILCTRATKLVQGKRFKENLLTVDTRKYKLVKETCLYVQGLIDNSHYRLIFYLGKKIQSILKWVKLQSLIAKCCKMRKI
jgi:hypothetical protein